MNDLVFVTLIFSIKQKKFIDGVEDLTIFVEKKENNILKNIIIKEKISNKQSQIIIAQSGEVSTSENNSRKIILNRGKIINTENNNISKKLLLIDKVPPINARGIEEKR